MCTRSLSGDEEACGSGGPHHQVGALSYILSFCCVYLSASASHRHQLTPSRSLMCHQAHIYTGKFSCTNTHTQGLLTLCLHSSTHCKLSTMFMATP